jgi:TonB family protein
MEAVSSVLIERAHHERGLPRMVTASLAVHVVLIAAIILMPPINGRRSEQDIRTVMTISLGGAPGPAAGGMTMMGRPIQSTAPLPDAKRPAPLRPPAAAPPAMTMPKPSAAPAKAPPKPRAAAADASAARAAAAAQPLVPSSPPFGAAAAVADPGRGMGFGGLSTGGSPGGGSYLDVANFCCPDYLVTMLQLIQNNWSRRQEVGGDALVVFRIQRDGRLTDIELEKSSGYPALDLTAQRALFLTQKVPPLPSAFPDDHLTVHLRFEYRR